MVTESFMTDGYWKLYDWWLLKKGRQ